MRLGSEAGGLAEIGSGSQAAGEAAGLQSRALWSVQAELVSAEFELGLAWARFQRALGQFEGALPR